VGGEYSSHLSQGAKMSDQIYIGAFDGSAKPNPGEITIGGWIADSDKKTLISFTEKIGYGTNNEAEYLAFIRLLKEAKGLGIKKLSIKGDSSLVVNQINGTWKIKEPRMKELNNKAHSIMEGMVIKLTHVKRKFNIVADSLTR
jgi:ribonuclease HI